MSNYNSTQGNAAVPQDDSQQDANQSIWLVNAVPGGEVQNQGAYPEGAGAAQLVGQTDLGEANEEDSDEEDNEDSEEQYADRELGPYIPQWQPWWHVGTICKRLMSSGHCALGKGIPWGTPDPATHKRLRSHPRPECVRDHGTWIFHVEGCASHQGKHDNEGHQNPITGEWWVPPCVWCRRERERKKYYLTINYEHKRA